MLVCLLPCISSFLSPCSAALRRSSLSRPPSLESATQKLKTNYIYCWLTTRYEDAYAGSAKTFSAAEGGERGEGGGSRVPKPKARSVVARREAQAKEGRVRGVALGRAGGKGGTRRRLRWWEIEAAAVAAMTQREGCWLIAASWQRGTERG